MPKYHDSGRLRGYGHVTFKTKKGLTKVIYLFLNSRFIINFKALEKNQNHLGSRYITVELAKPIEQTTEES